MLLVEVLIDAVILLFVFCAGVYTRAIFDIDKIEKASDDAYHIGYLKGMEEGEKKNGC